MSIKKSLYFIIGLFWLTSSQAQKDTLLASIKTNGSDTSEVRKYIKAGVRVFQSDLNKASLYWRIAAEKSSNLSKKYKKDEPVYKSLQIIYGEALSDLGYVYNSYGKFDSALYLLHKALDVKLLYDQKLSIAETYNNIAYAHRGLENYGEAITYNLKALEIRQKLRNNPGIAVSYLNIASLYERINDTATSAENYKKSLSYYRLTQEYDGTVNCLNSLSVFYTNIKKFDQSKACLDEALLICNQKSLLITKYLTLHNIGYYHQKLNRPDTALIYYYECLNYYDSIKNPYDAIYELVNIAKCNLSLNNNTKALEALNKGLDYCVQVNDLRHKKNLLGLRWKTFQKIGKTKEALRDLEEYQSVKDSIDITSYRDDLVRKQMQFEYRKKTVNDSIAYVEKQKYGELKLEQQQTLSLISIIASVFLALVAFLIFKNLKVSRKNNLIISHQKKLVEEKNKEITDSINYAKRLQNAILTSDKILAAIFKESFVLFKPKDIVSGDFYWINFAKDKNTLVLAAADCTGHGVPGAFMSMLNSTLLNQTPYNPNINSPADTLNFLNEELPKNLRSNNENENINDGMDIAFCLIDLNKNTMKYSGANNPCWIIRNNELIELKPLKQAITAATGYDKKPFIDQEITLQKNDSIYLFTDGYADQFGGPNGKKFKYKTLAELLVKINNEPAEKQKEILESNFENWKGNLEQVDDVLILGFKV